MMNLQHNILARHRQNSPNSCIPMGVELALKLLGRMPEESFTLQDQWQNRTDGSFANFDNRTINGVRFRRQFGVAQGENFPFTNLLETITNELAAGRGVIIALRSNAGAHIYLIHDSTPENEFKAITYIHGEDGALEAENVREVIQNMHGTDILTYEVLPLPPVPKGRKTGRNDPCSCGSGKKYKKCCGK